MTPINEITTPTSDATTALSQLLDSPLFNIQGTQEIIQILIFLLIAIIVTKIAITLIKKFIEKALTQGNKYNKKIKADDQRIKTIQKIASYLLWVIATLLVLQNLGIEITALIAALGVGGIAIAFGAQETIANIIAGLVLIADKPFKVGNRIYLSPRTGDTSQSKLLGGDNVGDVIDIGLRSTKVRTLNNAIVIIPNAEFTKRDIWNLSVYDPKIRLVLDLGISYESNQKTAKKILLETSKKNPKVLQEPNPTVLFKGFGESGIDMALRVWIKNPKDAQEIISELYEKIKEEFDKQGIEIPYPRRQIVYEKEYRKEFNQKIEEQKKQTKINNKK